MARPKRESFALFFNHSPGSEAEAKRLTDEAFECYLAEYDAAPNCECGGKMRTFPGPSTPWPMKCEDCGKHN